MWKDAQWIGIPAQEYIDRKIYQGDANDRFAYFRLTFDLNQKGSLKICLSANSRYRFWINGQPVLSGPCRGDRWHHYYDEMDVSAYLKQGRNVFAVQVLLGDFNAISTFGDDRMPLISIASLPAGHRLAIEGCILDQNGAVLEDITSGKADWRVCLDNTYALVCEHPVNDNMGAITEHIDFRRTCGSWKKEEAGDSGELPEMEEWKKAVSLEAVNDPLTGQVGFISVLPLFQRPIPLLKEQDREIPFAYAFEPEYQDLCEVIAAPHSVKEFTLNCRDLLNAFMRYTFDGGRDAKVTFTYFERFVDAGEEKKTNFDSTVVRDDAVKGVIPAGQRDTIILDGEHLCYEPFWFRTMRFLKIRIETADEEVRMSPVHALVTGYPLETDTEVHSSVSWVETLYDMCVRTLRGCMMDAYMDCPFYEQMQYPMDTRLQSLFTYVCSSDTRLARKALEDFHSSLTPYGYVQGRAPSGYQQIISTFSVYYVQMILEYYRQTGDVSVLKAYRADVDRILETFAQKEGRSGLAENLDYWEFVDWQSDWGELFGRPRASLSGPSAVINLMYAQALEAGAQINENSGRPGMAQEYRKRKEHILSIVKELCWDPGKGLLKEGPDLEQYCQYTQARAVLLDLFRGEEAKEIMRKTFLDKDVLPCNFSTSFELFRAVEKAECYKLGYEKLQEWIQLIDEHCLTCPETPHASRSECHGWSALPMYEIIRAMAGIRGEEGVITIRPHLEELPDLSGKAAVPGGVLSFRYEKTAEGLRCELIVPEHAECLFTGTDGTVKKLHSGRNVFIA